MLELAFSRITVAYLLLIVVVACNGGPLDQPTSPEPAMELRIHLGAAAPAGATELSVQLAEIPYCPPSDISPRALAASPTPTTSSSAISLPFDGSGSREDMTVVVGSGGDPQVFGCRGQPVPLVRFFDPQLFLVPQADRSGPPVPWLSPDALVAYAEEPAWVTSFGPDDAALLLPRGYSILRRVCGESGRPWRLVIAAAAEPLTFLPPSDSFYFPQPPPLPSALLERREQDLLAGCGITTRPVDLGPQLSLDWASDLAFSANDDELLFLRPIDSSDPAQGATLGSINLTDKSVHKVAVVTGGTAIQTNEAGDIYVATPTSLVKVERQPDGTARSTSLPQFGGGLVSPDGQWVVTSGVQSVTLWNVATGAGAPVLDAGLPVGWSPESLLLEQELGAQGQGIAGYTARDPASGSILERFPSSWAAYSPYLGWGIDGPVLLGSPTLWTPQQPASRVNQVSFQGYGERDFGLSFEDLRTGGVSAILDSSAGQVFPAARAAGQAFVWARTCQGLFETVCSYELHRITLPNGDDQVVAIADSAAPVAVSFSGSRIAIAARDGIHVRDLP